jgi:hypothetical protein
VPDGVRAVWVGLTDESVEVVGRRPRLTLVAVRGSHDTPYAEAARLTIDVVITVGRGHSPLRTLFVPPLATLNTLPSALDSDVRQCRPASYRGPGLASLMVGRGSHSLDPSLGDCEVHH